MTFTHLAIHTPHPEHRDAVLASMHRVDVAAAGMPGLIRIGAWREIEGGRLVGLAEWESREAFEAGAPAIFAVVENDPFDVWEPVPPMSMYLDSTEAPGR